MFTYNPEKSYSPFTKFLKEICEIRLFIKSVTYIVSLDQCFLSFFIRGTFFVVHFYCETHTILFFMLLAIII